MLQRRDMLHYRADTCINRAQPWQKQIAPKSDAPGENGVGPGSQPRQRPRQKLVLNRASVNIVFPKILHSHHRAAANLPSCHIIALLPPQAGKRAATPSPLLMGVRGLSTWAESENLGRRLFFSPMDCETPRTVIVDGSGTLRFFFQKNSVVGDYKSMQVRRTRRVILLLDDLININRS